MQDPRGRDLHFYFGAAPLTLLTTFSGVLTTTSGCFPFLDGVRFILGEWNLSINFMVNEER